MSSWKVKSKTTVHKTTVNRKKCVYLFYRNAAALDTYRWFAVGQGRDAGLRWGRSVVRCRGPNRSPPQQPGDNGPAFLVIYCQEPALPTGNLVNTMFPVTLLGNLSPNMVKRTLVFRRSCDQRISSVACEPHVPLITIWIKYNMLNLYILKSIIPKG